MTTMRIPVLLLGLSAGFGVVGVVRWNHAVPHVGPRDNAIPALPERQSRWPSDSLDAAQDLTVDNDPFRIGNAPALVRYDPDNDAPAGQAPTAPARYRPVLVLRAVVGGPPWQAVIDGLPGQPAGTIVRSGDSYDKILIKAVTRDSVVAKGPDTTWVLTFRGRS